MILMGRIVAPFGIHGWLKVQPLGDDPLSWRRMPQWWIGRNPESQSSEDWRAVSPNGLRPHGKGVVLALSEISDRTAAEAVDGWYLAAPREALPKTAKDEYYWTDLVGLAVVGRGGVALGRVDALIETGAHAVLQIQDGETERLIPFVAAYVEEVDLSLGVIRVDWEQDW
ncbi:ribosome maturation factor RimM [Uliginosibacterium paludis]|uniref:Ribosome maturation factor RimM n=1 Tax=Uliginosibacterium paludis TaxID=1615952 RepID=A0ABV2CRE5_9RHOO